MKLTFNPSDVEQVERHRARIIRCQQVLQKEQAKTVKDRVRIAALKREIKERQQKLTAVKEYIEGVL